MEIKKFIHDKSLYKCIVMDLIGMGSYLIPFIGEGFDVIWAPISAFIFFRTFGGSKGMLGGILNFIEEALPGLDIIPTFTIMYFLEKNNTDSHNGRKTEDAKVLEIK